MSSPELPPRKPAPPVTQEEVDATRATIRDILAKAGEKSALSGKPLLIMVGEDHYSSHAALLETLIYQEAHTLGIRDIALELPSRPQMRKSKEINAALEASVLSRSNLAGHIVTYHLSKFFGDELHYVDGRHDLAMQRLDNLGKKYGPNMANANATLIGKEFDAAIAIPERNQTIAANLANIPKPVLLMAGADHLHGLSQRMQHP